MFKPQFLLSCLLKSCCFMLLLGSMAKAADMDQALSLYHVKGQVYVLDGAGVNVTVQIGDEAIVFVDTPEPQYIDEMMALIRQISSAPVRYVITTALDPMHLAGNDAINNLGFRGFGGRGAGVAVAIGGNTSGVTLLAHENVLNRFYLAENDVENLTLTTTYFTPTFDFYMNDEGIAVYHMPNAHTDGDSIVFFRSSDVISFGDLLIPGQFPDIDVAQGGSINGFIEALNFALALMIPGVNAEGGTYAIPGHGRLGDEIDVVEYRNMLVIVRDRIQYQMEQGMSLNQIIASNPVLDYSTEYEGSRGGPTSTEFITAIYESLSEEME